MKQNYCLFVQANDGNNAFVIQSCHGDIFSDIRNLLTQMEELGNDRSRFNSWEVKISYLAEFGEYEPCKIPRICSTKKELMNGFDGNNVLVHIFNDVLEISLYEYGTQKSTATISKVNLEEELMRYLGLSDEGDDCIPRM